MQTEPTVTKFTFKGNGQEVYKVEPPSGGTLFFPASVPIEALVEIRDRLQKKLRRMDRYECGPPTLERWTRMQEAHEYQEELWRRCLDELPPPSPD